MTTDTLALHFKYCAFIAIMMIVAVATDRWSEKPDFTVYLSNAATMTSLLLAVVAIFYSFVSNDSLSRSLGGITAISSEVQGARQQIGQYLDLTRSAADASSHNAALLRDASQAVTASLASLDDTLRAIAGQNQTLQELVGTLPTRIDQLESKVGDVAKALGEKPAQTQTAPSPNDISASAVEKFLARATLAQNLLAFACISAAKSTKPLSIEKFCQAIELNAPSNLNGFLNCMHAIQLMNRKSVEGQDKVYLVTTVHPELDRQTRGYFTEYVERTYADKHTERTSWLAKLARVEALFS